MGLHDFSSSDFLTLIIKAVDSPSSCFLSSCDLKCFIVTSPSKGLICFVTVLFTFRFFFLYFCSCWAPKGFYGSGHTLVVTSLFRVPSMLLQSQTPLESFISPGWFPFLFKVAAGGKLPCCFSVPGDQAFLVCFTTQWAREDSHHPRPRVPSPCEPLPLEYLLVPLYSWISWCSHTGAQEHDLFCNDLRAECWNEGKVKSVHAALSLQTQEGGLCWQWASVVARPPALPDIWAIGGSIGRASLGQTSLLWWYCWRLVTRRMSACWQSLCTLSPSISHHSLVSDHATRHGPWAFSNVKPLSIEMAASPLAFLQAFIKPT